MGVSSGRRGWCIRIRAHLLEGTLKVKVRLAELIGGAVLNLKTLESLGKLSLDGSTVLTLDLGRDLGVGD